MKSALVLFSSGFDSTVMLDLLLKETNCAILSLSSVNLHDDHAKAEAAVRSRILDSLDAPARNKGRIVERLNPRLDYDGYIKSSKFGQIPFWFFTALAETDPEHHSSVNIGYCVGDQCCQDIHHLKKAWKALWKICKVGKCVKLQFPLLERYFGKSEVLSYVENNLPEVLNLCHYCETPVQGKNNTWLVCGTCMSCKRMHGTDIHIAHLKERVEHDKASSGKNPRSSRSRKKPE